MSLSTQTTEKKACIYGLAATAIIIAIKLVFYHAPPLPGLTLLFNPSFTNKASILIIMIPELLAYLGAAYLLAVQYFGFSNLSSPHGYKLALTVTLGGAFVNLLALSPIISLLFSPLLAIVPASGIIVTIQFLGGAAIVKALHLCPANTAQQSRLPSTGLALFLTVTVIYTLWFFTEPTRLQSWLAPVLIVGFIVYNIGWRTLAHFWSKSKTPVPITEEEQVRSVSGIHGDAHYAITTEVQAARLFKTGGEPIGHYFKRNAKEWANLAYNGITHILVFGQNRSGKGVTFIIPTLLKYDASSVIIDPKGEDAKVSEEQRRRMGQEVFFLNPFPEQNQLPSHGFNPLARLDPKNPRFAAEVAFLAEAIIVHDGDKTHWADSARDVIEALIMWVCTTSPSTASLPLVRALLCQPFKMFQNTMRQIYAHDYTPMANKAARFVNDQSENEGELQGILSTAMTQTKLLDDPAIAKSLQTNSFDWADLKRKPMTVYLILPPEYLTSHGKWLRLLITSALSSLQTTAKAEKPVLFILDEFAQLGNMRVISDAMGLAAGYGIQLCPILQDLNQLKDLYPKRWETFMANAGAMLLLSTNDMTTAEYFSKRMGNYTGTAVTDNQHEITMEQWQNGFTGKGHSSSPAPVLLASPQALIGMPQHLGVLFVSGLQYPVLYNRVPYYEDPAYNDLWEDNPFHSGNKVETL